MSTDALNTAGEQHFLYPDWQTLIGQAGGEPPGPGDNFENVRATRVVQSASGSRLDFAELEYALTTYLIDRVQPADFSRMIEVTLPDGIDTRLHRGDYVSETERVEQDAESLTAQSQLRPYHFGEPVKGMLVFDPASESGKVIPYPVTFNPSVDDQIRFNRSDKTPAGGEPFYWLHGEAAWTPLSREYHEVTEAQEWTLAEAVEAVCDMLNGDETFIANPTDFSILDDAPKIRDVTIPLGKYLPQVLDMLLIPLGFNWYLDYRSGNDDPQITFFEIGVGDEKELWYQAPGESVNLAFSNVNEYEVSRGIGDSFNQVRVLGGFKQYEVTLPLYPGWPETDDEITPGELNKTSEGGQYEGHENVWRLFVANEDGTLDPTAPRLGVTPVVPDLSAVSDPWVPRRRNIEEPLTYMGQEGDPDTEERRPFFLEYADEVDEDGDPSWKPVPEDWSVRLLPDQIGVYLDGDSPPQDLFDAAEDLRMQITGTIMVDERLVGEALRQSHAVNGRDYELLLDMPDKFVFRERLTTGDYASRFHTSSNPNGADERDDSTAITEYAEQIRDKNENAEIDCEFKLPGLHIEYQIGDLLTRINGREISLDAASEDAPAQRYVQIVERRFEYGNDGPMTVLVVDRGVQQ
jgi:hypothetical protein